MDWSYILESRELRDLVAFLVLLGGYIGCICWKRRAFRESDDKSPYG